MRHPADGTPTRNIALTAELHAYVQAQIASGLYSNATEVERTGLRLMIERDRIADRAQPASGRRAQGA